MTEINTGETSDFRPKRLTWKTFVVICIFTIPIWYITAWRIVKGPVNHMYRGDDLLIRGRFEESLEEYEKALSSNPGLTMAWAGKGLNLLYLGRFEEALASYDRALTVNPKMTLAWQGKGISYEKLGLYDDAIKCYEKGIELSPDNQHIVGLKNSLLERSEKQQRLK